MLATRLRLASRSNPIQRLPQCQLRTFGNGPDDVDFNASTQDIDLGLQLRHGSPGSNPRMKIVPTAGLSYAHSKLSAKDSYRHVPGLGLDQLRLWRSSASAWS